MPRNHLARSKGRLTEVCAHLTSWMDELRPVDASIFLYSQVASIREDVLGTLEVLDQIESAGLPGSRRRSRNVHRFCWWLA